MKISQTNKILKVAISVIAYITGREYSKWAGKGKVQCLVRMEFAERNDFWICTRAKGHKGPHIAIQPHEPDSEDLFCAMWFTKVFPTNDETYQGAHNETN